MSDLVLGCALAGWFGSGVVVGYLICKVTTYPQR